MPKILELMIKYKTPITISTKSDLILRDMDLLEKLAKVTTVNVAVTITTWDENMAQKLEPGAISSQRRMKIFEQLKGKGINLGLHLMPIIPYLTDTNENLENILREAGKIKVDYVIAGMLNLRSETRKNFLMFIQENYPELTNKYFREYKGAYWEKEKRRTTYFLVHKLMQKYGLNNNYEKFRPKEIIREQLSLI
jgi:DNA repair photolyase